MMILSEGFGARLRQAREEMDVTQVELASAAGTSQSHISMLESSERANPSLYTLKRLATALDTTVGYLADGDQTDGI